MTEIAQPSNFPPQDSILKFRFMGFNQSHLAVYQGDRKSVLEALGFIPTGAKDELPASSHVCAMLPNGWFILVARWGLRNLADEDSIRSLSVSHRVITGYVCEMDGSSAISCWENGSRMWEIEYDANRRQVFKNFGTLPPEFKIVSERHRQLGMDGLDRQWNLPPETGEAITGFLFDREASELGIECFDVLKPPAKPERKSFLQRIFGI